MCSDYDNPYDMSDQEFEYRAMNPQDPMYMGDKNTSNINTDDPGQYNQANPQKKGKNKFFTWDEEDTFMAILALIGSLIIVGIVLYVELT